MNRITSGLFVAAVGLVLSACGSGGGDGERAEAAAGTPIGGASGTELAAEQVLRIGNGTEPQSLDPHKAEGTPSANIQRDLFEGLINEAPNGDLIPGAAKSWTVSDDGKTYTFALRENARWSNGDPVTAHDFVYGLRRALDPATLSRYTFILSPIKNAEAIAAGEKPGTELGVRAIDDFTLEIQLENPTPYFLGLLTHSESYPVNQANVEKDEEQFARAGKLVSNGAYQLAEWVPQSHVKLVRNPYYWDNDNTTINEIWFYPTEDQTAELQRFRAGELDITYTVPKAQLPWIRKNLPDELSISPYLGIYYYGFNVTKPPFKDNPKLRRALTLAIDRDIITKQITNAGEIPAYGWIPSIPHYGQQTMAEADWTQAQRNEEARRLYEEAGYSQDHPLNVEILYNTQEDHKRIAVAIASMWREVLGVQATLRNQEWKVFLDTRFKKKTQVYRAGWIGDYDDPYTFMEILQSTSELNNSGYDNPEFDKALRLAAAELDPQQREQYLQQAERLALRDLPVLPIYFYVYARMIKPWVGGFQPNIMDHHRDKNFYILKH